ncbi:hypothetical protein MTR67_030936, partial [Solanum verrucosum]
ISDRGPQFTPHFWKSFQKGLGTHVNLRTTFHQHMDGYHSSISMSPYEELYGRRCKSPVSWFEVGKTILIGPDLVHEAMEIVQLIRERVKTTQNRQKSYADVRRRDLEFEIDDWIFLKVSHIKGVIRFGKKGKLSPRYIGPVYKSLQNPKKGWYCGL